MTEVARVAYLTLSDYTLVDIERAPDGRFSFWVDHQPFDTARFHRFITARPPQEAAEILATIAELMAGARLW